eukprot:Clim_evm68s25 gene=Clim_evmTU68s25
MRESIANNRFQASVSGACGRATNAKQHALEPNSGEESEVETYQASTCLTDLACSNAKGDQIIEHDTIPRTSVPSIDSPGSPSVDLPPIVEDAVDCDVIDTISHAFENILSLDCNDDEVTISQLSSALDQAEGLHALSRVLHLKRGSCMLSSPAYLRLVHIIKISLESALNLKEYDAARRLMTACFTYKTITDNKTRRLYSDVRRSAIWQDQDFWLNAYHAVAMQSDMASPYNDDDPSANPGSKGVIASNASQNRHIDEFEIRHLHRVSAMLMNMRLIQVPLQLQIKFSHAVCIRYGLRHRKAMAIEEGCYLHAGRGIRVRVKRHPVWKWLAISYSWNPEVLRPVVNRITPFFSGSENEKVLNTLKPNDHLIRVAGQRVIRFTDLSAVFDKFAKDGWVELQFLRLAPSQ